MRALYKNIELPGNHPLKDAHAVLDAAVFAAYGFKPKGDVLGQLLELNVKIAANLAAAMVVTGPGIPRGYPAPKTLVTCLKDCRGQWSFLVELQKEWTPPKRHQITRTE